MIKEVVIELEGKNIDKVRYYLTMEQAQQIYSDLSPLFGTTYNYSTCVPNSSSWKTDAFDGYLDLSNTVTNISESE